MSNISPPTTYMYFDYKKNHKSYDKKKMKK